MNKSSLETTDLDPSSCHAKDEWKKGAEKGRPSGARGHGGLDDAGGRIWEHNTHWKSLRERM